MLYTTSDFDYQLPSELIAQYPLTQRSASRLLHVDVPNATFGHCAIQSLGQLLRPGDLLVLNDTKVIPARLYGHKETGGAVEILIERVLSNNQALAQIRASKPPKAGGDIHLGDGVVVQVRGRQHDLFELQFPTDQDIWTVLDQLGHMPLPPYITRADEQADTERYQTVFARVPGAVAAPTAGLHLDKVLLGSLQQQGIQVSYITLHVGAGTFQPVRTENLAEHRMHSEWFDISSEVAAQICDTRQHKGRVVAVGTTVLRALESASQAGTIQPYQGDTSIFITPGFEFRCVDALLTNFHLPRSTLLMLVSAFGGYELMRRAYQEAITQRYRFYSYGDAMFIAR